MENKGEQTNKLEEPCLATPRRRKNWGTARPTDVEDTRNKKRASNLNIVKDA